MQFNHPIDIGLALAASWVSKNGWRREDSRVEELYSPEIYIELAQKAEQQNIDFLFRPDVMFLHQHSVSAEPGFSSLEPISLLSTIATHTQKIGLVATISTSFFPPYIAARQLQSLQWLSKGRAGWNIVTALEGGNNFGQKSLPPSELRYQIAQEFVDVVQKLWASYPYKAIEANREQGIYADTQQIQPIEHCGEHFSVEGPLNLPSYPNQRVAFFQAGSSDSGRDFAVRNADAIFAAIPDYEAAFELKSDFVNRAELLGRSGSSTKVYPGVSLFLGQTKQQAEELFKQTHSQINLDKVLMHLSKTLSIDLQNWPLNKVVELSDIPDDLSQSRSITHANLIRRRLQKQPLTLHELLITPEVMGSAHWLVVGTADDAVASIIEHVEKGSIDGLIAIPGGSLASVEIFFEQVMPKLRQIGLAKTEYAQGGLVDYIRQFE